MLLRLESVPSSKDAFGSCLRRQWKMDVTLAPIRPQEHPETPHDNTDPPPPPRSIRIRALEIRDLVRVGELSRAVARADAAQLARPSASTIACLSKLHPPPQTQIPCPRVDILPPSLALPTHPLSNSLVEQIMTHKLPFSSRPQQPTTQDGATSTACGRSNWMQGGLDIPEPLIPWMSAPLSYQEGELLQSWLSYVMPFKGVFRRPCALGFLGGASSP